MIASEGSISEPQAPLLIFSMQTFLLNKKIITYFVNCRSNLHINMAVNIGSILQVHTHERWIVYENTHINIVIYADAILYMSLLKSNVCNPLYMQVKWLQHIGEYILFLFLAHSLKICLLNFLNIFPFFFNNINKPCSF